MPPTVNTEEVIEKKASSPVATSCLVIAGIALLGAIAFQVIEIAEYRSGAEAMTAKDAAGDKAKKDSKKFKEEIETILEKATLTPTEAEAPGDADPGKAPTEEVGAEPKEEAEAAPDEAKAEEAAPADEKAEDAAAEAADAKADEAKAADTAEEPAGDAKEAPETTPPAAGDTKAEETKDEAAEETEEASK